MSIQPDKKYASRTDNTIRPSWSSNILYINSEHQRVFEMTKDIPGWQMEGDTYKLYEMAYFSGDVILEIGTYGGRSAVVELLGALTKGSLPQFFGIDVDINSIKRTYYSLCQFNLSEHSLLFHGTLQEFMKDIDIQPTMCFVDGDHLYEGVKKDLDSLSELLRPGVPVLCHDYLNPENETGEYGVRKAATEWEEEGFATFMGVFGCSALFVTTEKCKGKTKMMLRDRFDILRKSLITKYGIKQELPGKSVARHPVHEKRTTTIPCNEDVELTWLDMMPQQDGFTIISQPQKYAFDEKSYDEQYNVDATALQAGSGLVKMVLEAKGDVNGTALEIGCGTGVLSLGLVKSDLYPSVLLTDPSKVFLKITKRKISNAGIGAAKLRFAVLKAEEMDRLPCATFSLIVLRSTLHHILDYHRFIREASQALRPGGILTFQEPCLDGYVLMGALAQFIPLVMKSENVKLTDGHVRQIQSFVDTMKFYARRDIDKTKAEDKHLFRPDEIIKIGGYSGLSVEFLPNITYEQFDNPMELRSGAISFFDFFHDYLKYCMSFDQPLMELIARFFRRHCDYIEEISSSNAPFMHGVFICRKE